MNLRAIYDELKTLPQEEHLYEFAMTNWREKAAVALAYCYEHGEGGVEKDLHEAFKWYKVSAERGNREHRWKIANWYLAGKGVKKSYVCAVKWFTPFAEEGNAEAMYNIGLCHYNYNGYGSFELDWKNSVKWYRKAAELGYPPAMYKIARCYLIGLNGVKEDIEEGMKWLIRAAKKGNAEAQEYLGLIYELGNYGIPTNKEESIKWYAKAARQGKTFAQYRYAMHFYWQKEEHRKAVHWFTKASKGGCEHSPYWLGSLYEKHYGNTFNPRKAAYWYRIGASRKCKSCKSALIRLEKEIDY